MSRIFKNTVSVYAPDYSIKSVFIDKLKALGFKIQDPNPLGQSGVCLWINEETEGDYYGDFKVRYATQHLYNTGVLQFNIPKEFHEALMACTETTKYAELKLKLNNLLK